MDNLIFTCSDALDQPATPACTTEYGERIVRIILMKTTDDVAWGTEVTASDAPTAADFEVGIASDYLTVFNGISNGHKVEIGATELSGDDTVTGGTERHDVIYRVEGRIKVLNESVARATEKLDRYSQLRLWYFTDRDYCFGGASGYKVSPNFGLRIFEGAGQPAYIPFTCDFIAVGEDYAAMDADYSLLDNS